MSDANNTESNENVELPDLTPKVPEPGFLDNIINEFNALRSSILGVNKESGELGSSVVEATKSISGITSTVDQNTSSAAKTAEQIAKTADKAKKSITELGDKVSAMFKESLSKDGPAKFIEHAVDSLKKLVGPTTAIGAQVMATMGLEEIEKATGLFTKIQEPIMAVEKSAMQMQLGMGSSFDSAVKNIGAFRVEFAKSMVDTKSNLDAVTKTQGAFRDAFRADEVIRPMNSLEKATGRVRASMTLTNAALLVGAAKGMDSANVAAILSKAHLELGASTEEAATALGDIALASEGSGLSFEKSSDAIVSNAQKLAMWGGTIKSVAPLLQAFTSALGDNRKGLAPQLLSNYVDGLERMGFEMRALTGISTGVGGGKGALGAGLEMEALLEKGEGGMEEVSQRLIDTIKQFSGGKMVTREEAIADPALEQNFIVQRKLLQQMVGGSDASSTKMLNILKQIDENGLKTSGDAEAQLGELMGEGQRTQDRTTGSLVEQTIKQTATIVQAGEQISRELSNLTSSLQQYLSAGRRVSEKAAKTGTLGLQDIRTAGKMSGNEKLTNKVVDSFSESLGIEKPNSNRANLRNRAQVEEGIKFGREKSYGITDTLVKDLLKIPNATQAVTANTKTEKPSGKIPMEAAKSLIDNAVKELAGEIEKVSGGQYITNLDNAKKAEIKVLEERVAQLQSLSKEKFILPEQLGVKSFNQEPRDSVKKDQRPVTVAEVKIEQAAKKETPENLVRDKVNATTTQETPRALIEKAPQTLNRPMVDKRDINTVESSVSRTPEKTIQDLVLRARIIPENGGVFRFELNQEQFDKQAANSTTLSDKMIKAIRRENTKT